MERTREMKSINDVIKVRGGFIIGMVHCLPLPGSPSYQGDINKVMEQAVEDAKTLERGGVDAVMVENTNDSPSSFRRLRLPLFPQRRRLLKKKLTFPLVWMPPLTIAKPA
jgi:hypothetical protein